MVQLDAEVFPGTEPERRCYNALIQLGKIPDVDFQFQSSLLGGSVLGIYFHYRLNGGSRGRDLMTRELLAVQGLTLIFIDEEDLLEDARYYVEQALQYRDHSAVSTGGTP